ncbi:hypothetical protein [Herbiconiux sp.]|uniref:hypothetical protein n=1 Tax=Herbiconiux sp. TaxID=1871186 RepID=UPI0025BDD148|nr:hypothetical protein [Herbiconiux sp.]
MRITRIVLVVIGVLGLLLGALVLVMKQDPAQIVGVGVWMIGAILLHDAILSPLVVGAGILVRKTGRRLPYGILAIVQAGVVLAAILGLIVAPEIYAKTLGVANPTVLPLDYTLNLVLTWAAVAVLTAACCALYLARARRRASGTAPAQAVTRED